MNLGRSTNGPTSKTVMVRAMSSIKAVNAACSTTPRTGWLLRELYGHCGTERLTGIRDLLRA